MSAVDSLNRANTISTLAFHTPHKHWASSLIFRHNSQNILTTRLFWIIFWLVTVCLYLWIYYINFSYGFQYKFLCSFVRFCWNVCEGMIKLYQVLPLMVGGLPSPEGLWPSVYIETRKGIWERRAEPYGYFRIDGSAKFRLDLLWNRIYSW